MPKKIKARWIGTVQIDEEIDLDHYGSEGEEMEQFVHDFYMEGKIKKSIEDRLTPDNPEGDAGAQYKISVTQMYSDVWQVTGDDAHGP